MGCELDRRLRATKMGDERSYLDLHSFPRPLRTELHTNRHACALAVMISLRGAMPLEGAVLPQPEAEAAVLGLARPHRLPHASASSESNPDDCLGLGTHPIRSFAQTLFIIPGLQLPFIGREIGLRAFFCAWTPRIAQVFLFFALSSWPSGGMCSGFSASVLGQSVTFARAYLGR